MNSYSSNEKVKGFPGKYTNDIDFTRLLDKGRVYLDEEKWDEARAHFENMVQQFPDRAGAFLFLGITYRQMDLYPEAETTLRKALELDNKDDFTWSELGCALNLQCKLAEAEEAFRRALQLDSEYVLPIVGLADTLLRTERYKEARDYLLRGIELDPDNYWLGLDLGRAHFELGHYNRALKAFTRAATFYEDRSAPFRGIAMVHYERDDLTLAKDAYKTALDIDPEDHVAKRGLAEILVDQESFPEAEDILKSLLEIEEADCQSWALLGQVYLQTERIGLAEEAFNEALEECCNLELAHRGLLTIYERTGQVVEAEEKRERLRKMVDGEPMTDEVMDNIIQSIDPSIQSIIAEFHQLGLMTSSCCSGLPEDHPNRTPHRPYVYFWGDYEGAHHHIFTLANMAGWTPDYGVNGWGVEVSGSHTDPEDIRESWARLIQMARLVMPHLRIYIDVVQKFEWEDEHNE
ncbi:MAG: tetratricopeptide repeat protein [Candidatus Thorarchaeota archaeon]